MKNRERLSIIVLIIFSILLLVGSFTLIAVDNRDDIFSMEELAVKYTEIQYSNDYDNDIAAINVTEYDYKLPSKSKFIGAFKIDIIDEDGNETIYMTFLWASKEATNIGNVFGHKFKENMITDTDIVLLEHNIGFFKG